MTNFHENPFEPDPLESGGNPFLDETLYPDDTPTQRADKLALRLRKAVRRSGLRQADLADRLSCSRQTINKLLRGRQVISLQWASKIAPLIGTNPSYLLGESEKEENFKPNYQKYYNKGKSINNNLEISDIKSLINRGNDNKSPYVIRNVTVDKDFILKNTYRMSSNLFHLEISGQAMAPTLKSGDSIIIDSRKTSVSEGGLFLIQLQGEVFCRWVELILTPDGEKRLRIWPDNPQFSEIVSPVDQVKILGRVIWLGRML